LCAPRRERPDCGGAELVSGTLGLGVYSFAVTTPASG